MGIASVLGASNTRLSQILVTCKTYSWLISVSQSLGLQIHVEDLLLMSININMFGAPKVGEEQPDTCVAAVLFALIQAPPCPPHVCSKLPVSFAADPLLKKGALIVSTRTLVAGVVVGSEGVGSRVQELRRKHDGGWAQGAVHQVHQPLPAGPGGAPATAHTASGGG